MVLHLIVLDNQTTSLCNTVMTRDTKWQALENLSTTMITEFWWRLLQWQNPLRCKTKKKMTAKVISLHEEQTQQSNITTFLKQMQPGEPGCCCCALLVVVSKPLLMSETNLDLWIIEYAFFSIYFISLEDWMGNENVWNWI